ncbi:MAG: hypothetical protein ABR999_00195 [Methanoregula sp.]|jgi:hypothetical protein|uniref:hypothetical protein n=1 Tax=Methanoregula sp. TaxID=2052170 RepID=UPI003D0C64A9
MSDEISNEQNDGRQTEEESLFDVIIPPGVPRSVIFDVVKKFDVEVVERKEKLSFANMDGDERELLAFRARREVAEQVEKYMIERVRTFIGE